MQYGFTYLGIVPVRKEPKSSAEQVTQLLFGDAVAILDDYVGANPLADSWLKIRNMYDNYEGWIDKRNILPCSVRNAADNQYIVSSPIAKIKMNNDIVTIPMASVLIDKNFCVDDNHFTLIEGSVIHKTKCNPLLIKAVSLLYLNTPYQWGGKSIFGMDCSGLTQNVFKFAGIDLQRDASQQALQGRSITFNQIKSNDLCFFDNKQGHISHVGIYLGENKIIHCSGKVRIDNIDENGIYIESSKKEYSHHLCKIKTF